MPLTPYNHCNEKILEVKKKEKKILEVIINNMVSVVGSSLEK